MKPFITLLVLLVFELSSNGQDTIVKKDTIRIKHPKIVAYQFNRDFTSLDSIPIDTVLQRFQIFYKPISERAINMFLGNLNLPYTSVIYTNRKPYSDFPFADGIEYNFHQPEELIYYKTWSPFTEITYYNAGPKSRQEQKLNIIHTQNIKKNVNVGFLGDLNYADGQYINQRTRTNAFTLWSGYKGQKYSIYGNASINSYKAQENGGILNDDLYTSGENEASTIAVNLNKANTHTTRQSIFFVQRLYLTGSFKADSLKKNSRWDEAVSIIHKFKYERYRRNFTDDFSVDTAFYQKNGLNPGSRYFALIQGDSILNKFLNKRNAKAYKTIDDSAYFRRFENTFQLAFNANDLLKVPAELRFGIKNQIDKYKYGSKNDSTLVISTKDTTLRANGLQSSTDINTAFVGSLSDRFSKTIKWGVSGEYYITGSKAGSFDLNGDIQKSIKHNFILNLSGRIALTKPGYFIRNYEGSNIGWNNGSTFPSQKTVTAHVGIYHLKYKFFVDAQLDNYLNYLYMGSNALPTNADNVFVRSLSVNKLIDWGIFHTEFLLTFQNTSNKSAVAIPDFTGFNSTYIAFTMFKVLHVQYGVDVFYNSPFYANTYMPLTGMFYAQDQIKIKNNPYGDMFLNIKLKRFRFFLKYERVNTWFPNSAGFYLPHYPYNPSLLKYGLSWTFYD
jgi:hypothetical protein